MIEKMDLNQKPKPKTGKAKAACMKNLEKAIKSNIGRKQSKETQEKKKASFEKYWNSLSEEQKKRPWMSKKVICDGVLFESIGDACKYHKISQPTVRNRILSGKWDWQYV